mmetsp:Transcript_6487/g.20331  ORF Transcript_6487/g.20331 Transcript_6487/m.20331 type:complete len:164 (+) Transcript_6487:71-562(+)
MRRRRGRGMERWMDGRERDVFYITIAFLEDSFCRGKRRSENGEREREREKEERRKREEKRKEKQESEKRLVRMRTAKHFLRASAWLHVRERPDAFDSQQRLFFSFFFLVFLCFFSTFALCFLFYCRNDVNDDDDTDAENQFHPRFADKNNTVILYWSILRASG